MFKGEKMKTTIASVILMLSVVVTSGNSYGGVLDDTYVPVSHTFKVSRYLPTTMEFFSAAIKGLTSNGWKIDHVKKNLVNAKYGHNNFIEVRLVDKFTVKIQEIDRDHSANIFPTKWIDNIKNKMLKEFEYQYFMKKAEGL